MSRNLITCVITLGVLLTAIPPPNASAQHEPTMQPSSPPAHINRLINATSPYLLQHAHNPVDWYEWGPEALERAKNEGKPIFLSIGYSSCHWCHVMAHESFESEATAAIMNQYFVCIKVDREERPDIDEIYMQATLIVNQGAGGWPMSVWLTPDLKPFFAGTYFPPETRFGRPGFGDLCERIGEAWTSQRDAIQNDADRLTELVDQSLTNAAAGEATLGLEQIDSAVDAVSQHFDRQFGGVSGGGTNKFPPSMALDLFLRSAVRHGVDTPRSKELLGLVELTLDHMAGGGVYDQLGGGIHRYSTDVEWLVPHFEKMLYDQALVSRVYVDAYQFTRKPLYRRIAAEIFDYVIDDWQSDAGGIYSTRDADSEGQEGKYYVWTMPQIVAALGPTNGELFCDYYDVTDAGNWQDPHEPGVIKSILHVPHDLATVARRHNVEPERLEQVLAAGRTELLTVRGKRVAPGLDDKVLVEWNGMMIASLARGGAVLGERKYIDAAAKAADFILTHQYENGRLVRSYRDGRKLETAFLTDYACLIDGLIELYEATFEKRWLDAATKLNRTTIELFWDEDGGGFFFTAGDHEQLISRSRDVRDGATPSGNSVQLMNLLRLGVMLGDDELRKMAERTIATFAGQVSQMVGASERFLAAVEFANAGPIEIAVVGDPADPRTQALLRRISDTYLPNRVLMLSNPDAPDSDVKSPLLENRPLVDGRPAVYVCREYACKRPVTTPEELAALLAER